MAIVSIGTRTDVGRQRNLNEDSLLAGRQVWAIADGMGGHAAGDIASSLVVARLRILDEQTSLKPSDVVAAVGQANQEILEYAQQHPDTSGLGSTVAGVAQVIVGGAPHWAIFNVGDSRVYRQWAGRLARATVDHSETEELVLEGRITEDEARTHELRNIITRSVGTSPAPQVDLWVLPQTVGERFMICSDGLNSELDDDRIAGILDSAADAEIAAEALVDNVLRGQARDNVSVIVLNVEGDWVTDVDETTNPRGTLEKEPV